MVLHTIVLLWVTFMLPCPHSPIRFLQKQSFDYPPCLSFACGLMKNVGGASHDALWCMHS
jgi:hypothetical protein